MNECEWAYNWAEMFKIHAHAYQHWLLDVVNKGNTINDLSPKTKNMCGIPQYIAFGLLTLIVVV